MTAHMRLDLHIEGAEPIVERGQVLVQVPQQRAEGRAEAVVSVFLDAGTASQIAAASLASFFWPFTYGLTCCGAISLAT
jgi:hypothetical protein